MLSQRQRSFRFEDIEVDPSRRLVQAGSQTVYPRPRAFGLLVYLIERRDRVVSREELLTALWPGTTVTPNSLAQCVNEVRKMLGDNPQDPRFIRTVSRAGYQFIAPVVEEPTPGAATLDDAASAASTTDTTPAPATPPLPMSAVRRPRWVRPAALAALTIAAAATAGFLVLRNSQSPPEEPAWFESVWWKLREGAGPLITDSERGLSARVPAAVSWETSASRPALRFSGLELKPGFGGASRVGLPNGEAPRTLLAWIQADSTNGDSTPILTEGGGDPDTISGFSIGLGLKGVALLSVGHFEVAGTTRITDGQWHLIAGVHEGNPSKALRLYVDGREEGAATSPVALERANTPRWTVGSGAWGGTSFRGLIADARIFERALRDDEIRGLNRCMTGGSDLEASDGSAYFFAPIHGNHFELLPRGPGDVSAGVRHAGTDVGGIMLVKRDPECGLRSVHGARVAEDLDIAVELRVPLGGGGEVTEAGPFFRSRAANPGDGIQGGTSAGYWVILDSTGQVRALRLNPRLVLGFAAPTPGFNAAVSHELQAQVRGSTLSVTLDGRAVEFDVAGSKSKSVRLEPVWETLSPRGLNHGAIGIAFSCSQNRSKAGGQEARNIRVTPIKLR